ncbi:MAG: hypothetical protein ACJAR9_002119 [Celeribacter sp.]|jgi:hypothetical protein
MAQAPLGMALAANMLVALANIVKAPLAVMPCVLEIIFTLGQSIFLAR